MVKEDAWESEACDFVNEAECEERLEDRGVDVVEAEETHFHDEKIEHSDVEDEDLEDEDFDEDDLEDID
jgi:hypothetical protein